MKRKRHRPEQIIEKLRQADVELSQGATGRGHLLEAGGQRFPKLLAITLLPKLRTAGQELSLGLEASLTVRSQDLPHVEAELRQAIRDLGLDSLLQIDKN